MTIYKFKEPENPAKEMCNKLNYEQKCSYLALVYIFGRFSRHNPEYMRRADRYVEQVSSTVGVSVDCAKQYFETHGMAQGLKDCLKTINDSFFIEQLIFDCFVLSSLSSSIEKRNDASALLFDFFAEFGYSQTGIQSLMERQFAMFNMCGGFED